MDFWKEVNGKRFYICYIKFRDLAILFKRPNTLLIND